jgi:hypothetical protein
MLDEAGHYGRESILEFNQYQTRVSGGDWSWSVGAGPLLASPD